MVEKAKTFVKNIFDCRSMDSRASEMRHKSVSDNLANGGSDGDPRHRDRNGEARGSISSENGDAEGRRPNFRNYSIL